MTKTRRQPSAYTRNLIAACAAVLLVFAVGSAGAANPHNTSNLVQNPSLEQSSGDTPRCWLLGGYGTNSYQWTQSSDAQDGKSAGQLTISSLTNGDRKLLTAFSGGCSPAVSAGHSYTVTVWYKSSASPVIFAFSHDPSSSGYSYWAQSPQLASSGSWTQASWTTPVVPAGISNLSVGLGLKTAGSVTMDDFSMTDNTSSSGPDTTPPTSTISCNNSSCSSGFYNGPVTVALAATDDAGGSGVASIRYTTDGTTPSPTSGSVYNSAFSVGSNMTVKYLAIDNAGNAGAVNSQTIGFDTTKPTVSLSAPKTGATLTWTVTLSATASDNIGIKQVDFLVDGNLAKSATGSPYTVSWDSTSVGNGTHSVAARAIDLAGNQTTSAAATVAVENAAAPPPPAPIYFGTEPSHATYLPRSDSYCASAVSLSTAEQWPNNALANSTVPSSAPTWGVTSYWSKFLAKQAQVTGQFTGTTDQIFRWAACKWGIDENLIRAAAEQESNWQQSALGDNCGPSGEASYGILQIKNRYCDGTLAWGGYPQTYKSTAENVDFYAMERRACYDGDWYDGGAWLYNGQTVDQVAAAHSWDYVMWGCVGEWFSGNWYDSGAQNYISGVKTYLANKDWLKY
jgi:hypothetical protein